MADATRRDPLWKARMRNGPGVALIVVVILSIAAQLLTMDFSRALGWDEAVYLSQVRPDAEVLGFAAHRARGVTWMIAPVARFSTDSAAVRVYLALLSGPALWAAFAPWVRITGWAAPIAAFVYGSTWFVLVSHSAIQPNPVAALAAVAAVGWFVRAIGEGGSPRELVALAVAVAVVAVLRPTEAVFVCAGLLPALVGAERARSVRVVGALLAGGLVGSVPWTVESVERFGGPLRRAVQMTAATTETAAAAPVWQQYLSLVDTWLAGPLIEPQISPPAIVWMAGLVVCCGAGWVAAAGAGRARTAVALTSASLVLLLPYLLLNPYAHLRFLFPAYGVALMLAAVGVVAAVRRAWSAGGRLHLLGLAVLVGVSAQWAMTQTTLARHASAELRVDRESARIIGETVADMAGAEPCTVAADEAWPQIAFYANCVGGPVFLDYSVPERFAQASSSYRVYAVVRSAVPEDAMIASWSSEPVEAVPGWVLYSRPTGEE